MVAGEGGGGAAALPDLARLRLILLFALRYEATI